MTGLDREAVLSELAELWQAIDRLYARAYERHPGALSCRAGCADCCVGGLQIGPAEALAIEQWLTSAGPELRARVAALAERPDDTWCVLLDDEAACSIYPARPLVCRSFGLPMRVPDREADRRRLPLLHGADAARVIDSCNKNFVEVPLSSVDPGAIVDEVGYAGRKRALARGDATLRPLTEVVRSTLARLAAAHTGSASGS